MTISSPGAAHIAERLEAGSLARGPTASAIYEGSVRHRRFEQREHEFHYRLALAYIDLDELPTLLGGRLLAPRAGLVRFRRRHYLGEQHVPLAQSVRDVVAAQAGVRLCGPVRVLTNLSTFGHCFNPVSFYYCMDQAGENVEAVLAEVTNTPWGERHAYVLSHASRERGSRDSGLVEGDLPSAVGASVLTGDFTKALHVSPFMGMDHRYEWRMTTPGETLSVHIANTHGGRLAFDATLSLRRRELTSSSLARMSARYPAGSTFEPGTPARADNGGVRGRSPGGRLALALWRS